MKIMGWIKTTKKNDIIRPLEVCLWLMLQTAVLLCVPLWAANPVAENRPLANCNYKVQLVQDNLTGDVGEEIILSFVLDPPQPPQGTFFSVNMKVLQKPELGKAAKPKLLTGFPNTSAVFYRPGIYRYSIVVSLIAKSSCGGVKADTIFDGEVQIEVNP